MKLETMEAAKKRAEKDGISFAAACEIIAKEEAAKGFMNEQELKRAEMVQQSKPLPATQEKKALLPQKYSQEDLLDDQGIYKSDIKIARLKIIQDQSKDPGKPKKGQWRNSITGEQFEKISVVVLARKNGRCYLRPKDFTNKARICWSYDGVFPAYEEVLALTKEPAKCMDCASCEFSQWPTEEGQKQKCRESVSYLVVDANLEPSWIIFSSLSLAVAKKINANFAIKYKIGKAKKQTINMRDFRLTFGIQEIEDNRGHWYQPIFSTCVPVAPEEKEVLDDLYLALSQKNVDVETVADSEQEEATA